MGRWFQQMLEEIQKMIQPNIDTCEKLQKSQQQMLDEFSDAFQKMIELKPTPNLNENIENITESVENMIKDVLLRDVHKIRDLCSDIHKHSTQLPHIIARSADISQLEHNIKQQFNEYHLQLQQKSALDDEQHNNNDKLLFPFHQWLNDILHQLRKHPMHNFIIYVLSSIAWNTFEEKEYESEQKLNMNENEEEKQQSLNNLSSDLSLIQKSCAFHFDLFFCLSSIF